MLRRHYRVVVAALLLAGCEKQIHRLLEAPPREPVRLSMTVQPTALTIARGSEKTVTATVVRVGNGGGSISVVVDDVPAGVSANVATATGANGAVTATITLRASSTVDVGNYSLSIRTRATDVTGATALLVLSVIEPPDFSLVLSRPSITIARGGVAPLGIGLSRTNLPMPVGLSVSGQSGITAEILGNPVTGSETNATLAVDPAVAPGPYTVTVRGAVDGLERTASLVVNVTDDPLQVIFEDSVAIPQLSKISHEFVLNRSRFGGAVTLAVDGLPSGVTASFAPLLPGSATGTLTLDVGGSTPAGTYRLTLRASGAGAPDATATFSLTVVSAAIGVAVSPATASVAAGASVIAEVSITRKDFSGPVSLRGDASPGISVTFDSTTIMGARARATISVASSLNPATYAVGIRATPAGLSAAAEQRATLALDVRAPGAGAAVVLDWSRCTAPSWVAFQDGNGAWTRLQAANGVFQASLVSPVGGFAFVDPDNALRIRFMTRDELSSQPLALCPVVGTRVVRGTAVHAFTGTDMNVYSLGGGSGSSSLAQQQFTIAGVRDGVHDLVAVMNFVTSGGFPNRILIRRDIRVGANTDTLATINMQGPEAVSVVTLPGGINVAGSVTSGEVFTGTMSYLTTAECTPNLYRVLTAFTFGGTGGANFALNPVGIPTSMQRPDDYYLQSIALSTSTSSRASSVAFRTFQQRTLPIAPVVPAVSVTSPPGTYKRLAVSLDAALPSNYNRTITLQYGDVRASTSLTATRGYFNQLAGALTVPDFTGVAGWPSSAGVPASASGVWRVVAEGSSSDGSACVDGRLTYTGTRNGQY